MTNTIVKEHQKVVGLYEEAPAKGISFYQKPQKAVGAKHLLTLLDWSSEEVLDTLDLADRLKADLKAGKPHQLIKGSNVALIFSKASTRTRCSFDVGVNQLGGHAVTLTAADTQMGRGEPVKDTARVLGRYFDGIMIRTTSQSEVEELAEYSGVPVINGLTEDYHPCQILADLQTMREHKGKLEGQKLAWIGDGNNVCHSMIIGALKCGMQVVAACPEGYHPNQKVLDFAAGYGNFELIKDPKKAAKNADILVTDVWSSMGHEQEIAARKAAFEGVYQINQQLLSLAKSDCIVQHCLPAHRGEEITEEVLESHATEIFDEAENRLHAQKAV
ncbi:ornithine carbamoyltransferase, partial [Ruminococcaceae bacterium OttesenSCG-928-D13]|nr:ornithine carbamoyltransferase [Ruminococcaceae bacterium OttesenSCG-928-D13]